MKWHSVNEPPTKDGQYLCLSRYAKYFIYHYDIYRYCSKGWYYRDPDYGDEYGRVFVKDVLCWIDIPLPPKELWDE